MKIISRLALLLPFVQHAAASTGVQEVQNKERNLEWCGELITDGKASAGSETSWSPGGGGIVTKHPWGPNGDEGSYKHTLRSGPLSGPSQKLNAGCFDDGKKYDVSFKWRIADGKTGKPLKCISHQKDKVDSCVIVGLVYYSEGGAKKTKELKSTTQPWTYEAGEWVDFKASFWANSEITSANDIEFIMYGPTKGVIIQYDEVSVTQYLDPTDPADLFMGRSDPADPDEFVCTGPCCELLKNGDAESGDYTAWDAIYGGAILSHPWGPIGSTKSFKHLRRASYLAGPGQALNTKCLVPGKKYKLTGKLKLTNEFHHPYRCTTNSWKKDGTCPLATIRYKDAEGKETDKFFNINNSFGPYYWDKDAFNNYEAIFTVPEDLVQSEDALFVIRGPPAGNIILFDDFSLTPWHHSPEISEEDLETVQPCENECCQMILSGDAETGDISDWYVAAGGDIREHSYGPEGSTKSFKHVGRWGINDGPAQVLNPKCFVAGKRYIFHAQLKLAKPNGQAFRCSTTQWNQDGTCPIFTIKYTTKDGKEKGVNSNNDNLPMAWNKDYFNPFRAIFKVPDDFLDATQAYVVIRGASAGKIIMFDDVKLEPYLHIPPEPEHTELEHYSAPVCQGECCDLVIDRIADEGSTGAWQPKFGGRIQVVPGGPDGHSSHFEHIYRFTPHSGPMQPLNIKCLVRNEMYKFNMKFRLQNKFNKAIKCDTVTWGENTKCPMISIHFKRPNGNWQWMDMVNRVAMSEMTDGWNDFEAVFSVPTILEQASEAYFMIRGPGSFIEIKWTDVHIKPFLFTPQRDPPPLEIQSCDGANECCELIENGDAASGTKDGWFTESTGAIQLNKYDPEGKETGSFYHVRRGGHSEGPAQILNQGCLVPGKAYTLNMFLRTRNFKNEWYTCDTQEWNQPKTCPIVSLKYRNADGIQKYFNIQNQEGIKDYNGNWYGFTAMFEVPLDVNQAYEVDFMIRGPPKNHYIYWDDVSIKPFLHVPAEPKYDSATLETKETICTGDCCELITSGDAETGNVQDWFDYMGGNVIKHPWGPPYSKFSYKHIGRPIRNSGPAQQIDTRCLVAGVKYKFTGLFKLALNTGPTYACDTYNYQSETVCPLFSINFRNAEGKWRYINAENENHPRVWEKDYFNKYEAVFEVTPELANSDRAYIVIRGPPEKKQIFFDDLHLNPYFTDTAITLEDPLPVCDNECCELVRNGDAESGIKDDWINIGGGNLMIHPYGPPHETKSFKHLWRSGPNMGPGQVLNTTCLVPGEEYELTALLKVQDKNANNVKCDTTTWGTPTTCPLLRIRYVTQDGNEHYFNVNNRIPPSAWRERDFNLFTAFFTVTPALAAATDAHFLFSGPPTDYVIFFDNVSIKPWLHVPPPPQPSLHLDGLRNSVLGWGTECTGACCELVENGEGESLDGWKAFGGGKVGVSPNGAQGTSKTLVHMFRPYVHSGPGQRLNTACLVAGERYKFTAMYKLLNGATNKKCTTWNFHDPNACPLLSIRYKKSSGEWAYLNEANNMPLSIQDYGWNLYEATIIIPDALANSEYAYWVMRGLPGGNLKLYLDQVSFAPHLFNPAIETVPDKNADQACDGACCELVTSGNAQPGSKWKWMMFPEGYGAVSVTTAEGGANGQSKSFVSSRVEDIHSGPGQILENLSCFDGTSGQTFMFKAMFKVENAAGQVYNCAPGFGTSDACPIFSIKVTKPDGKFKWINGRNFHGDIINGFNNWGPYESVFEIPTSLADATSAYWVMRGLPKGYKIYLDEVSLSPVEDWGF